MLPKGLIVSLQIYSDETTKELAGEIMNGHAVAIRCDKDIEIDMPKIGLKKRKGVNVRKHPYITHDVHTIKRVIHWADYVAVDYRSLNDNLPEISDFCRTNKIKVVADIGTLKDYENILKNDYYYDYIATTFSHFYLQKKHDPDIMLIKKLSDLGEKNIIAEGNYQTRNHEKLAYAFGATNVCIGGAITDIYKQTLKYSSVDPEGNYDKERKLFEGMARTRR